MSEINTNYIFINEKSTINPDVYFTVDTTIINGHRICKLKTLKIYYHGELFEMVYGTTIYNYIIKDGIRSVYSVELINYLNRFINHENLYEIYSNDLKHENFDSKTLELGAQLRESQQDLSSFIFHDKSNEYNSNKYNFNLIDHRIFIKSELDKSRNQNYPICYSKYENIKNVPVYCYVHPSLAINQGNTVILCHIGYVLEKLANYKKFPEFNTQEVISFLNAVSEYSRTDKTEEKINNLNLEIENEKLQKKCKSLEKELEEIKQEISGLHNKIDTQSKEIDNQTSEIINLQVKLDNKSDQLETALTNLIIVTNKSQEFKRKSFILKVFMNVILKSKIINLLMEKFIF